MMTNQEMTERATSEIGRDLVELLLSLKVEYVGEIHRDLDRQMPRMSMCRTAADFHRATYRHAIGLIWLVLGGK